MVEKGINGAIEPGDLFPGVGVGRGLFSEGFRAGGDVEALFRKAETSRLAVE